MGESGTEQSGVAGDGDVAVGAAERLEGIRWGPPGAEQVGGRDGPGDHDDQGLEDDHAEHQAQQHPAPALQREPEQREPSADGAPAHDLASGPAPGSVDVSPPVR